jgi:hypothetical protein
MTGHIVCILIVDIYIGRTYLDDIVVMIKDDVKVVVPVLNDQTVPINNAKAIQTIVTMAAANNIILEREDIAMMHLNVINKYFIQYMQIDNYCQNVNRW